MMLVDAEAVEAHPVGELELVEVVVIKAMAELGSVEVARNIHPYAAVLVLEAIGQKAVRHQVEPRKFHKGLSLRCRSNASAGEVHDSIPDRQGAMKAAPTLPSKALFCHSTRASRRIPILFFHVQKIALIE